MLPESKDIIVFLAPGKLPAQCFKNRGPLKMLDDTHHITPWSEHNNGFLSHSGPLRSDSSPSGCSPRTVPPQTSPPKHPPYWAHNTPSLLLPQGLPFLLMLLLSTILSLKCAFTSYLHSLGLTSLISGKMLPYHFVQYCHTLLPTPSLPQLLSCSVLQDLWTSNVLCLIFISSLEYNDHKQKDWAFVHPLSQHLERWDSFRDRTYLLSEWRLVSLISVWLLTSHSLNPCMMKLFSVI